MKYVICLDGTPVERYGAALKDMAEARLAELQAVAIGTSSTFTLKQEG